MSDITPKDPMLYLRGDSLYEDATFRNEVELIEIVFGVLEDGKPPEYCPPETDNNRHAVQRALGTHCTDAYEQCDKK